MTEPHAQSSSTHVESRSKPGRMTAVMRAMAAPGAPRVLRVGLVREGRVVEERIVKRPAAITMGRDESCTFVVSDAGAPARVTVLERSGDAYVLDPRAVASGRVALVDGVHDVGTLRARGPVRLDERARGRVTVGDATLLFQFVAAPPPSPRPQLPLSVRQGLALDWRLTVIAAVSFLAHFGLIGAMYSDWSDPIVDEQVAVVGVVDSLAHLPQPEPELVPDPSPPAKDDATKKDAAKHDAPPAHGDHAKPSPDHAAKPAVTDRDARALAAAAAKIGIDVLASTKAPTAVQNALDRSLVPVVDLTDAAKADAVVAHGESNLSDHGAPIVSPLAKNDLGNIVGHTALTDGDASKHLDQPKLPPTTIETPKPDMPIPVPNAEATIARLRPKFRSCYNHGLAVNPTMAGSVTLRTKIAPNGEVVRVDPSSGAGLSDDVTSCLAKAVKGADFDPPGASGSVIDIPVKLVQQR